MGSLVGKSPANTYKSLLKVADESNGVSTSISRIEDGEGTATCLEVSDDSLVLQPQNDDMTTTLRVRSNGGTDLLVVDSTNTAVKVGASQTPVNSQLLHFAGYRINAAGAAAGTHHFVPMGMGDYESNVGINGGTGTDPSTTIDLTTTTDEQVMYMFNVPINITIDAVKVFSGTESGAKTYEFHLMSYTISNDVDSDDGNLSDGTVVADGSVTVTSNQVLRQTALTIQSASVSAGKVLMFSAESNGTEEFNINAQILYHFS